MNNIEIDCMPNQHKKAQYMGTVRMDNGDMLAAYKCLNPACNMIGYSTNGMKLEWVKSELVKE